MTESAQEELQESLDELGELIDLTQQVYDMTSKPYSPNRADRRAASRQSRKKARRR